MGSAALVAAVPYPGKVTGISCMGQGNALKQNFKNLGGGVGGSVIGDAAANSNVVFQLVTVRSWLNDETWVHGYKMKHGYVGPR